MTQDFYSAEEAKERFKSLPPEIQSLLYSEEMSSILQSVATDAQLHLDQLALLQAETSAVMLGFTDTEDFPKKVASSLHVEEDKAVSICKAISDKLFIKIRESMKQAGVSPQLQAPAPAPASPQPPAAPPAAPPLPVKAPEIHPADVMLSQKTVTVAPPPAAPAPQPAPKPPVAPAAATPPAPQTPSAAKPESPAPKPYSADPYREPIEP